MPYTIEYATDVLTQFRVLTVRQQRMLLDAIEVQLVFEPELETRNRKRMRPNPLAPWELRVGSLRVYYDVHHAPAPVVQILAVGIKVRNRVSIGGKEIEL